MSKNGNGIHLSRAWLSILLVVVAALAGFGLSQARENATTTEQVAGLRRDVGRLEGEVAAMREEFRALTRTILEERTGRP